MEDWQKRVIQKNLPKLLEDTQCNTTLLAILFAKELISNEEKIQINVIQNPLQKADLLYQIIVTRKHAYDDFIKACREVKQSGVVYMLENGKEGLCLSNALDECNISDISLPRNGAISVVSFDSISNAIADYTEIGKFEAAFECYDFFGICQQPGNKLWLLRGQNKETFLHIAAAYGYVKLITYLIRSGLHVSTVDNLGRTPGHYIGQFSTNIVETSKILIQNGLHVSQVDVYGLTMASTVVYYGKINQYHYHRWIDYMIKNRYADVFVRKSQIKATPLHHALQKLDLERETIELIVKSVNININQPDDFGHISLHWALMFGRNLKNIKTLIELGGDYRRKDKKKEGVLHFAVKGSNREVVRFLLLLKLDINEADELGETPLHKVGLITSKDYLGMTNFLLDNGADLCAKDRHGNTIAHVIALAENISCDEFQIWVKGMIVNGYSRVFDEKCFENRTPLHSAMQRLDLDYNSMKLLLGSSKMDVNQIDTDGHTPLPIALRFGRNIQTIKNLIYLGTNLDIKNKRGSGILHSAVVGGNKEVIEYLMSQNFDVNLKNDDGNTPLHGVKNTRLRNYFEITKLLLDNGANLYSKNKIGNTLAHQISLSESVDCDDFKIWVTLMIKTGHSHLFTTHGFSGRNPLQSSMERLDVDFETMKLIVESTKLDINQPDYQYNTILHLALSFGRSLDTIKNLIALGADWRSKGLDDRSVIHSALEGSNEEAFIFFKSLGVDVNTTNTYGQTPLHYVKMAKNKDYFDMSILLVDNDADLYFKNRNENTLAHEMALSENVCRDDFKMWVTAMIANCHGDLFISRGQYDRTFLHSSMERLDLDFKLMKLMIESAKLDVNQPDGEGNTILHLALRFGRSLDTIKNLVNLGSHWKKKGRYDCNVLHYAVLGNNKEAFLYFQSLGADINLANKLGQTPLHYVRWVRGGDYLEITKFLLENGANLNAKNNNGKTLMNLMSSDLGISSDKFHEWKEVIMHLEQKSRQDKDIKAKEIISK